MAKRTYNPERDILSPFINQVATWIRESEEVFVLVRYLEAAGAKDFAFCRSIAEFESLVAAAPVGADIEVFRARQLPIRGIVTETFISDVLGEIPNGTEYMIVAMERQPGSILSAFGSMGDTHDDLRYELESLRGTEVATGSCPNFIAPDGPDLISASKGGVDGAR